MRQSTGADILCKQLESLGVTHIFGLPGTQNVALFEALRNSSIRTLVATSELAAGFMANGYYRASGKPGVLTTIPGPGFAYTVPAIAEAMQDSAAVLYIAGETVARGRAFDLQAIDQVAILRPVVKCIFEVKKVEALATAVAEAYAATTADEPGPVLLQVSDEVMRDAGVATVKAFQSVPASFDEAAACEAMRCLRDSKKVAILAGQGANVAGALLTQLAELLPAMVFARGLPAAIGAKLAMPDRPVVSLISDGGFAMSGMELITAVREKIPVCVIIFEDSSFGHIHGTTLETANLQLFAKSIGARYLKVRGDFAKDFSKAILDDQVTLVEVELSDSQQMRMIHVGSTATSLTGTRGAERNRTAE